jgi:multiple sugar transport system substrate-binding protein
MKNCTRVSMVFLAVSALCFVLLVGNAAATGQREGAAEEITLNYWRHGHQPAEQLETRLITEFEEQNPNVKVEMFVATSTPDLHEKLLVAFAGGAAPDVYNMEHGKFPEYLHHGFMDPVKLDIFGAGSYTDLVKKLPAEVAAGLPLWEYQGKYYGLTTEISCYTTAINTNHFREAGLDPDKDYPKTWTQLAEVGKKLVKTEGGEIVRQAYALTTYPVTFNIVFQGMIRQLGSDIISPDGTKSTVNSPAGVKALQTLYDLIYRYKITAVPSELNRQGPGFETGDTSIVNDVGPWYKAYLENNAPTVAPFLKFTPNLRFEGGKDIGNPNYGYALQVSTASKHKNEAWKLAQTLCFAVKERRDLGLFVPDEWPWPKEVSTGGSAIIPKAINDIVFEAGTKTLYDREDPQKTLTEAKGKLDKFLQDLPYKLYGYQ